MHHPTDRITHTTAFVTPVVGHWLEREIAQKGPPRQIDPMTHHTMSERSYHRSISRSISHVSIYISLIIVLKISGTSIKWQNLNTEVLMSSHYF